MERRHPKNRSLPSPNSPKYRDAANYGWSIGKCKLSKARTGLWWSVPWCGPSQLPTCTSCKTRRFQHLEWSPYDLRLRRPFSRRELKGEGGIFQGAPRMEKTTQCLEAGNCNLVEKMEYEMKLFKRNCFFNLLLSLLAHGWSNRPMFSHLNETEIFE